MVKISVHFKFKVPKRIMPFRRLPKEHFLFQRPKKNATTIIESGDSRRRLFFPRRARLSSKLNHVETELG